MVLKINLKIPVKITNKYAVIYCLETQKTFYFRNLAKNSFFNANLIIDVKKYQNAAYSWVKVRLNLTAINYFRVSLVIIRHLLSLTLTPTLTLTL